MNDHYHNNVKIGGAGDQGQSLPVIADSSQTACFHPHQSGQMRMSHWGYKREKRKTDYSDTLETIQSSKNHTGKTVVETKIHSGTYFSKQKPDFVLES